MPHMAFGHHHYTHKTSVCLFEFQPRHKERKKHQYKFITKEDQKTGIGENKKKDKKRVYIHKLRMCDASQISRYIYLYIYIHNEKYHIIAA